MENSEKTNKEIIALCESGLKNTHIAEKLGLEVSYVKKVLRDYLDKKNKESGYIKKEDFDTLQSAEKNSSLHVEKEIPEHYRNDFGFDVIDFNNAYGLNFNLGSAVKYISRAGKKGDKVKDLKKAIDCIEREIKFIESKK